MNKGGFLLDIKKYFTEEDLEEIEGLDFIFTGSVLNDDDEIIFCFELLRDIIYSKISISRVTEKKLKHMYAQVLKIFDLLKDSEIYDINKYIIIMKKIENILDIELKHRINMQSF